MQRVLMVLVTDTLTCFGLIGHQFSNCLRDSSGKKNGEREEGEQLILQIDFYTIRRVIENLGAAYKKNLTWERTDYLQ